MVVFSSDDERKADIEVLVVCVCPIRERSVQWQQSMSLSRRFIESRDHYSGCSAMIMAKQGNNVVPFSMTPV